MTLVLNLEPELERAIQSEANRNGVNESDLVVAALRDRFGGFGGSARTKNASRAESDLLMRINATVPDDVWNEYDALVIKRDALALSNEEHARLIEFSDEIERIHFARIRAVAELAVHRGVPLTRVMDELGIGPRHAASAD